MSTFLRQVQELLGLFDSPDAHIRLTWLGEGGWAAEISRYTIEEVRNIDWSRPVEEIKTWLRAFGVRSLIVVPICSPSQAKMIDVAEIAAIDEFGQYLEELTSAGPWILAGKHQRSGAIRPCFVDANVHSAPVTNLDRALLHHQKEARRLGLVELAKTEAECEVLAKYVASIAKISRRHSISATSFDALTLVADHPEVGVSVLAHSIAPEDIVAVLELEIELPFLWILTPINVWADAFKRQAQRVAEQISFAGVDDMAPALRATLRTLEQICATMPELSAHASCAAYAAQSAFSPDVIQKLAPFLEPFQDRIIALAQVSKRELQNQMVRRRVDGLLPPNLDFSGTGFTPATAGFDPQFDQILSVPSLVDLCANGAIDYTAKISRLCKLARLYDESYFLEACPAAVCKTSILSEKASLA